MKKKLTAFLSLFILLGIATAPTVMAQDSNTTEEDNTVDEIPCNTLSYLFTNCMFDFSFSFNDGTADVVHQDIATQMAFAVEERSTDLSQTRNYLNRTYGVAMAEAKLTAMKELNNGSKKAEANSESLNDINDFYTTQQKRILETKNREVLKLNETVATVKRAEDLQKSDVFRLGGQCHGKDPSSGAPHEGFNVVESNYTLYNGTEITSYGFTETYHYDTLNGDCSGHDAKTWTIIPTQITNTVDSFWIKDLDGDKIYQSSNASENYQSTWTGIADIRDRSYNNSQTVISEIYNNYNQGEINVSDQLGPLEPTQLAATNYEQTGSLDYAALSLEQMGLATNETASFKISYVENNETRTAWGNLFVTSDYDGSLEAGQNYTLQSAYFMEQLDGEVRTIDLSGKQFSIAEMVNPETGDQINKTTVQNNRYYTMNTTGLENQLEEMREDFQELAGNSGGGFWTDAPGWLTNPFGDVGISKYLLAVIAVLAVFVAGGLAT